MPNSKNWLQYLCVRSNDTIIKDNFHWIFSSCLDCVFWDNLVWNGRGLTIYSIKDVFEFTPVILLRNFDVGSKIFELLQ